MKNSELVFVGIKGSVLALDRATGKQVWAAHLKGSEFVTVMVDGGQVLAATHGEVFCLNLVTGEGLWHNPLRGFGTGLASLATEDSLRTGLATVLAEKRRRDEAAAAAVAASAASGA